MSVIYKCDICKKSADRVVVILGDSPLKHICPKCWQKVEKILKEKIAKPEITLKKSRIAMD